jgi:hypothetical protein
MRMYSIFWLENFSKRAHLGDPGIDVWIIFIMDLKEIRFEGVTLIKLFLFPMEGYCEYDN